MNNYIVGAGGLGRELAASLLKDGTTSLFFVDDGLSKGTIVNGIEVIGGLDELMQIEGSANVYLGVGSTEVRKSITQRLLKNESLTFPNHVSKYAVIIDPEHVQIGIGNFIAAGTIITTNVKIGDFNLVNLSCTIGHDAELGDYTSLMPSVNISGGATLKEGIYIGTGAKLIKSSDIGSWAVVGAGAVVNKDIPSGETWAGIPAMKIK